jgi:signal transduction histidine kinase/DNA-binding response OmpR family regulator
MSSPSQNNGATDDEKVNILIVDDRPDKLLAHEVVLSELNQNIVCARSGKEALRCLLQNEFAVILLDVNMPGMDGFETAALIRQRPRSETTPIIFISAMNDSENFMSRGYSLGAVDYILAPVVPEILRAKLAVFVDLYKKTEQVKRQAEERATFAREQAARAEAEARQERLAFLAHASKVLGGSLECKETLQNLAQLIVPKIADFCVVQTAEENDSLLPVAVAHSDSRDYPKLRVLAEQFPTSHAACQSGKRVFETGKSEIHCDLDAAVLQELFDHQADRDFVRSMDITAFIAVPLRTRDRLLGTITMINVSAHRECGPDELSLAEDLAQRAGLALDNAGLYDAAQKARMDAERANRAKDGFLAMLSHELRTPLTPVLTSVLALEAEENLPEETRESLQMIRRNVELEARLIDDLLDLTRISKGKVQLSREVVDAHLLLRNAVDICQSEIEQKKLALQLDLAATKVDLLADPARLQQIFWNLIKNAVKFTPKGGRLTINTTNEAHGELRVSITDTGLGIDPSALPKIFDAFEQADQTRLGGLGLGLAISKALIEMHDGRIVAESGGRGQGATFSVFFPVAEGEARQISSSAPSPHRSRKSMRILLVEDHEDTNRSLTNLLRRRGYHVQPATTFRAALDYAANEQFDVLVSDIGLPDGSGIDLLQKLNAARPITGIALTGFGMESDIRQSRDVGFSHHLIKPVDLNKLDSIIQEVALADRAGQAA